MTPAPSANASAPDSRREPIPVLTRAYERLVILLAALAPSLAIVYLYLCQDPARRFVHHALHEAAITLAVAQSGFIAYVAWRCYQSSGEPLLRWMTLSFLGFTLIYAPHGLFTFLSDQHLWLFLLYGPVSRLVLAACLLVGVLVYGRVAHPLPLHTDRRFWLGWLAVFLALDGVIGYIALSWPHSELLAQWCATVAGWLDLPILASPMQTTRLMAEGGAILLCLAGIAVIQLRGLRAPLMVLSGITLAYFAQASLAFMVANPWDHVWWLAHLIGAAGFTLLSYGVVRAYHTTRAFSLVFSQEEVMARLAEAKAQAEEAARQLQRANDDLEKQASTDPLTGLANRRHFLSCCEAEVARAQRAGTSVALLALDLDHFKQVNDVYGHAAGDAVLRAVAQGIPRHLRPSDLMARMGGEEFMILLPDMNRATALDVAERIRQAVAATRVESAAGPISVTVSIGAAEIPADGERLETVFKTADERLYQAKHAGRNRVQSG